MTRVRGWLALAGHTGPSAPHVFSCRRQAELEIGDLVEHPDCMTGIPFSLISFLLSSSSLISSTFTICMSSCFETPRTHALSLSFFSASRLLHSSMPSFVIERGAQMAASALSKRSKTECTVQKIQQDLRVSPKHHWRQASLSNNSGAALPTAHNTGLFATLSTYPEHTQKSEYTAH